MLTQMKSSHLLFSDTLSDQKDLSVLQELGGKAYNLFKLRIAGFPVPEFAVLPSSLFSLWLSEKQVHLTEDEFIQQFRLPSDILEQLIVHFGNTTRFAVRSSAIGEDSSSQSFAGQYASYLHVTTQQLEERIRDVWRSAFVKRISAYEKFHSLESNSGIAVIVQKMIDVDHAGVGFGVNPVNGNRKQHIISAVYGLGEGLVSGELNADTYSVTDNQIESTLAIKTKKVVFDSQKGSGTLLADVPYELSKKQVLKDQEILLVSDWLKQLHRLYNRPQDIEFGFQNGKAYLLQTRPITTVGQLPDPDGAYLVWDNSNIIESYPGLTSPLTFSFIRKMYEAVYIQFTAMMGVHEKERIQHAQVFSNMLGMIDGRVYYNLRNWYKVLSLMPGYQLNAGFMEKMMGVKERFTLTDIEPRTRFNERLRVLNMIRLLWVNQRRLPKMRRDFVADFELVMQRFEAIDFSNQRPDQLIPLYYEFEQTLLKKWKAPLVNDFFAMIWYGLLQKQTAKNFPEHANTIHNDLLCGARDIISTEPIRRIDELTNLIRTNKNAATIFDTASDQEILHEIQTNNALSDIRLKFDAYIRDWGDRTVGELKLETITYRQQPEFFIRILKSALQQKPESHKNLDLKMRADAEQIVKKDLSGKLFKRWLFNLALRKSRDLVSNRENLRYARTRAFGMVRRIVLAIGDGFYREGVIDQPRDIFWLKLEEAFDFIRGTSDLKNLRPLIALRKNEYKYYSSKVTSERIPTRGMVYVGNKFEIHSTSANDLEKKAFLKGIGCCPGVIKARVRVVENPYETEGLNGDILVTASTDPGWVTLFPSASAILVERGSLLSHSAIVSREMGKPCIVGITGLLQRVKTGDIVEMNGSTAEIYILEE